MTKFWETPSLRKLLPFVRSVYGRPSCYKWRDSEGVCHDIHQHEGGEQGDPLMPLLSSLAIHNALLTVKQSLLPGELLFAFLDDIYVVSQPGRIREVYDMLGTALQEQAGIRLHSGKTRVWNKAGIHPLDIDDLGARSVVQRRRENSWHSGGFGQLRGSGHQIQFVTFRSQIPRTSRCRRIWHCCDPCTASHWSRFGGNPFLTISFLRPFRHRLNAALRAEKADVELT